MRYSVELHKPYEEVLAGLWNAQRFEHDYLTDTGFPDDVPDTDLFTASPAGTFDPEQIDGSPHDGQAHVLGKLIVPKLLVISSAETRIEYPEGAEPLPHEVLSTIEQPNGADIDSRLIRHQTGMLIHDLSVINPLTSWADLVGKGFGEYTDIYNQALPTYQRYAGFLLSIEGVVPWTERPVLENIQNMAPIAG